MRRWPGSSPQARPVLPRGRRLEPGRSAAAVPAGPPFGSRRRRLPTPATDRPASPGARRPALAPAPGRRPRPGGGGGGSHGWRAWSSASASPRRVAGLAEAGGRPGHGLAGLGQGVRAARARLGRAASPAGSGAPGRSARRAAARSSACWAPRSTSSAARRWAVPGGGGLALGELTGGPRSMAWGAWSPSRAAASCRRAVATAGLTARARSRRSASGLGRAPPTRRGAPAAARHGPPAAPATARGAAARRRASSCRLRHNPRPIARSGSGRGRRRALGTPGVTGAGPSARACQRSSAPAARPWPGGGRRGRARDRVRRSAVRGEVRGGPHGVGRR